MSDQFTLKLSSPITDEQWDAITDVDFDQTEEIFFHTKHGKEVTFVKRKKGKWIDDCTCSICHWIHDDEEGFALLTNYHFCPMCGADMRGEKDE